MLTIENKHTLINQRIVLSIVRPDMKGTYKIYNMYDAIGAADEYHLHIRHINKLHSDIRIVLNRFKTGKGYILWNEDKPISNMLLTGEQIKSKQTFLKAIEMIMIMN